MKRLSLESSLREVSRLSEKLGIKAGVLERFVRARPWMLNLGIIKFHVGDAGLVTLWYPQTKTQPFLKDIFEAYAAYHSYPPPSGYSILGSTVAPALARFLTKKQTIRLYALVEWYEPIKNYGHVLQLTPADLLQLFKEGGFGEFVLWPHDLSWQFGATHESFCYLVGSRSFVDSFKRSSPELDQYHFQEGKFYLGWETPEELAARVTDR